MTEKYNYAPSKTDNISFAGTTENFIFTYTPTYVGMIPVYEMPVAGSMDKSLTNSSAPGSFSNNKSGEDGVQ